eukprot:g14644.t1
MNERENERERSHGLVWWSVRGAYPVCGVDVRLAGQQQPADLRVAVLARKHERRLVGLGPHKADRIQS